MAGTDNVRVVATAQKQFDIFFDEASLVDLGNKSISRSPIKLKSSCFVFQLVYGKDQQDGTDRFIGFLKQLHNAGNYSLGTVQLFAVKPGGGYEFESSCDLHRAPGKAVITSFLFAVKGKRLCLVIKFKAIDTASKMPTLTADLQKLFESPAFSDTVVVCGDQEFKAHRVFLSARSEVFRAMFGHDETKESQTGRVEILDLSPKTVSALLRFIYTDEVKPDEITVALLEASHKYLILPLFEDCKRYLSANVKLETVIEIFAASFTYEAEILKKSAINFIIDNFDQVKEKPEWGKFIREFHAAGPAVATILEASLARQKK